MAADPRKHHYAPGFLLRRWEGGQDGKLSAMRWRQGRIVEGRLKAKSVAKLRDLYAVRRSRTLPDQTIERDFVTAIIDDPATVIHRKPLAGHVVSNEERSTWTHLPVAFIFRFPEAMEDVRRRDATVMANQLDASPESWVGFYGLPAGADWRAHFREHAPNAADDFGTIAVPVRNCDSPLGPKLFDDEWSAAGQRPNAHPSYWRSTYGH